MLHLLTHFIVRLRHSGSRDVIHAPVCRSCVEKGDVAPPTVSSQVESPIDGILQLKRRSVAETDAHNERFIEMLRDRPFIKECVIVLEDDPCVPCRQQSLRVAVHELPVLPWVRCTKREGCGCWYRPPDQIRTGPTSDWTKVRPLRSSP